MNRAERELHKTLKAERQEKVAEHTKKYIREMSDKYPDFWLALEQHFPKINQASKAVICSLAESYMLKEKKEC